MGGRTMKNIIYARGLRRGGMASTCGSARADNGRGCRKTEPKVRTYCQGVREEISMVESDRAEKERKDPAPYTPTP